MKKHCAGKKTKFVVTIGPASNSPDIIRSLIRAGVDLMRLNFSHGTKEEHAKVLSCIRKISQEEEKPTLDMKDDEIEKLIDGLSEQPQEEEVKNGQSEGNDF